MTPPIGPTRHSGTGVMDNENLPRGEDRRGAGFTPPPAALNHPSHLESSGCVGENPDLQIPAYHLPRGEDSPRSFTAHRRAGFTPPTAGINAVEGVKKTDPRGKPRLVGASNRLGKYFSMNDEQ